MDSMERKWLYLSVVVIIIVVALLLFFFSGDLGIGPQGIAAYDNVPVPQSILSQLAVPNNVSNAVGIGGAEYKGILTNLTDKPNLTLNGKPEVLYMGAEYCPYCAAERWGLIVALMRFGTFNGIDYMTSSASDVYASTPTFTFYNATYTSSYITLVTVELNRNKIVNGSYPTLQTPTAQESSLLQTYDVPTSECPSGGCIPFIDVANVSTLIGASTDPATINTENWSTIASLINNPSTLEAQQIVGTADLVTAQICKATNGQPTDVCSQPYVSAVNSATG